MRRNQRVHAARCTGQPDVRTNDGRAHRSGRHTGHIDERNAPPAMHQLQRNAEENLYNQIHHDVHDADVHEHIRDEAPGLRSHVRIVDEESCRRTVGRFADLLVCVGVRVPICVL